METRQSRRIGGDTASVRLRSELGDDDLDELELRRMLPQRCPDHHCRGDDNSPSVNQNAKGLKAPQRRHCHLEQARDQHQREDAFNDEAPPIEVEVDFIGQVSAQLRYGFIGVTTPNVKNRTLAIRGSQTRWMSELA